MNNKSILITVILVVVTGIIGFYIGTKYQQNKQPGFNRQFGGNGQQRGNNMMGNRSAFRPVNGDIISQDDKSITVKLQDGSSKIVIISDKTTINKASTGTKEDLKTGEKVAVFGAENADGSVTATNVQLNPLLRGNLNISSPSAGK